MIVLRGRLALTALSLVAMAACGGGKGGNNNSGNQGGGPVLTVSGTVNYEFVRPNANCNGLNLDAPVLRPIRGATVQLLGSSDAVLGTTISGEDGSYVFTNIDANTMVRLRVRAELKQQGAPSWDVEVRDNFDDSGNPPPLGSRPLYVADGSLFNIGSSNASRDLTATTGWGGSSYTGARAAAPFAILDTIYTAIQFVLSADATANFPALDVFWSVNNTATVSGDLDAGELGTSSYFTGLQELFLLGDADSDTDEFDDHVVLHEWGHYFEDAFSRSDSRGGAHNIGESLEAALAFGEAWGHAFAAMALDEPIYCDTGPAGSSGGFSLSTETGNFGVPGWFNEWGIATVIYDLWDTDDDGSDNGSIGWGPIYNIMTGPQASGDAFTTVFSFAAELRAALNAQGQAFIDSQLARENIVSGNGLDIWASNETNNAGVAQDVLPLYTDYTADGSVLNVCMNNQLDGLTRDGNNVGEDRYLRISVPLTDEYDVVMAATTPTPATADPGDRDQSDPDFYIYDGPQELIRGWSSDDNLETARTPTLQAGTTYIAFLEEWRFQDVDGAPASFPSRMCFDVSFTPTP
ncbi:MAG: hypothetical protein OEM85_14125 [Gammaproteobacteria bacterium]|nr:hypothetical protein [Gammaproteobacteria bacterium]MDH3408821.1 hypothetical protein [Gammaproteobacteria bacterium]